jgi:hypothetical protein
MAGTLYCLEPRVDLVVPGNQQKGFKVGLQAMSPA